ncbi:formyl-CoA transferase [Sporosarcina sp. P21c]|uniref:CaiB/BaiF CoA transferase family protein n=1 Tax=unclassified Sporosarcina TaxID=2647733 RepID=UPI000C16E5F3|nr:MULTISPECIES: CaiB/BaiF CoA-transferase family protein [unclassified Sporosarcina]PIC66191.1 formyl-CoA transferase [Sporosarcina sp. P16a]PIC88832.1 formyl-CoA transferase [Sporosarcina sp. P21c]PIC91855.1 formyl-CoA transferase [Sporosarcina sp. P25]
MKQALNGIKVLDLSRTLAGPYCSMLLGDMGADIIKVEQPGKGDESRYFTPPTWNGESCYFLSTNRNKRSITIDLKSPEGKEIIYKLVEEADVLLENFRTGALDQLGFGYEEIKRINPRLVYCSISGFGRTGPEKSKAGYDLLLQGFGGLMSITGDADRPPAKAGMAIVDLTTGMFAAYGILTALLARGQTDKGQFIDVSLLDGQISLLNHMATGFFATGKPAGRMGSSHPSIVPYQSFKTKDQDIILAVGNDGQWAKCCDSLGWTDLYNNHKYKKNSDRVDNRNDLIPIISERLSKLTNEEIIKKLEAVGVPCGPIHTLDQVLEHPQVKAREMVLDVEHPIVNNLKIPGFPVKLSDTPATLTRYPPLLGEHTEEVMAELGYTSDEIKGLKERLVIGGFSKPNI